jgi:amino acid permease
VVSSLFTLEAVWYISDDASRGGPASADGGFLTMARAALGAPGEACTASLFWCLLTAICVAYVAEGGHLVAQGARLAGLGALPDQAGSAVFLAAFAALAVAGTRRVDDLNRLFMGAPPPRFSPLSG